MKSKKVYFFPKKRHEQRNGKPLLCPDQRLDIRVKPIFSEMRNVGVANSCRVFIEISPARNQTLRVGV